MTFIIKPWNNVEKLIFAIKLYIRRFFAKILRFTGNIPEYPVFGTLDKYRWKKDRYLHGVPNTSLKKNIFFSSLLLVPHSLSPVSGPFLPFIAYLTRGQRPSHRVPDTKSEFEKKKFTYVFGTPGENRFKIFLRYLSGVPNTGYCGI